MDSTRTKRKAKPQRRGLSKGEHARLSDSDVVEAPIDELRHAPENDAIYGATLPDDPATVALSESIRAQGVLDPVVRTLDGYIVSGNRRVEAARLAGLYTVPCRTIQIRRSDDTDKFAKLLCEHNKQRVKSNVVLLREAIVEISSHDAHEALIQHRAKQAHIEADALELAVFSRRKNISPARRLFLAAVQMCIEDLRPYWPLSDRRIHYSLLNNPPLIHASKPKSTYTNTPASYNALVDLLARARLEGSIPMAAIADETRPTDVWEVHPNPAPFLKEATADFLKGYYRDLMQSQPNHVEIVAEKNTVRTVLRGVAADFTIPFTISRGYASIPPRYDIAQRYRKSGKAKLVLLIVSDFDADGEEIARSFARSMRDDFNIEQIHAIKAALTFDQIAELQLPKGLPAKKTSSQFKKFRARYGDSPVYELEAVAPAVLQDILRKCIESVIDVEAFNREIDAEKNDARFLEGVRAHTHEALRDIDFDGGVA